MGRCGEGDQRRHKDNHRSTHRRHWLVGTNSTTHKQHGPSFVRTVHRLTHEFDNVIRLTRMTDQLEVFACTMPVAPRGCRPVLLVALCALTASCGGEEYATTGVITRLSIEPPECPRCVRSAVMLTRSFVCAGSLHCCAEPALSRPRHACGQKSHPFPRTVCARVCVLIHSTSVIQRM